jgi:hypothetical protein
MGDHAVAATELEKIMAKDDLIWVHDYHLIEGLGRTIRYQSLNLDEFERSIDQALGPSVGKRISAIFRFIERHPDDLEFLARRFVQLAQMPAFEATDVAKWVAAHKAAAEKRLDQGISEFASNRVPSLRPWGGAAIQTSVKQLRHL